MKLYIIEDLTGEHSLAIAKRLQDMDLGAEIDKLYWLPVPEKHLSALQQAHKHQCGPYVMALELLENSLRMELLIRARNMLRCECIAYATPGLQAHMSAYIDTLLNELGIAP